MSELENLESQFKSLILNTCNVVGCEDCILKWTGGCRSDDLQDRIMELEQKQVDNETTKT